MTTYNILDVFQKKGGLFNNCNSFIDVGCGLGYAGYMVQYLYPHVKRTVGLDISKKRLEFCRRHNLYNEYLRWDLHNLPIPYKNREFDILMCMDVIEDLEKTHGFKLLDELERIAQTVIVSTPREWNPMRYEDNPEVLGHISHWTLEDFRKRGYTMRGTGTFMIGQKKIAKIAAFIPLFVYRFPRFASDMIAIKGQFKVESRVRS